MALELASGDLGSEATYSAKLEAGMMKVSLDYKGAQTGAGMFVSVDMGLMLDKLAETIPGQIDDAIIALLKGAVKAL